VIHEAIEHGQPDQSLYQKEEKTQKAQPFQPLFHFGAFGFGTGSWPWPPHGWHETIRLMANHEPFTGPHTCNASMA
jgi:hypothetical protein